MDQSLCRAWSTVVDCGEMYGTARFSVPPYDHPRMDGADYLVWLFGMSGVA